MQQHPPSSRCLRLGVLLVALVCATAASATPTTIRLEPKPMDGVEHGRAVVVKGEAGPEAHRFLLDGISYMMPVAVALRPVDAGNEVALSITKYAWNQPLRQGSTDGDLLRYLFRTEGEFQVSVTAPDPGTPYRLLVWVGDEAEPVFAPVVVKASEFDDDDGVPAWWYVAGGITLALLAGLVLVLRSKRS